MVSMGKLKVAILFLTVFLLDQGCSGITATQPPAVIDITNEVSDPNSTKQLNLLQMNVEEWVSTSPDGTWLATGLVAFTKENIGGQLAYIRLIIFSADGKTNWTILDQWKEVNLGFPVPTPLKWSRDGNHFYFTQRVIPDGCSAFPFLTELQQVNLQDGSVANLLSDSAIALALSPDDSQVAYFLGGEGGLILRDLKTGRKEETKLNPSKDFDAGNILWSPDGQSLALTLAINPCTGAYDVSKTVWAESTTILWLDAKTLQQNVLVQEDPRLFITREWNEPGKIIITDGKKNALWYLNVDTGEITKE